MHNMRSTLTLLIAITLFLAAAAHAADSQILMVPVSAKTDSYVKNDYMYVTLPNETAGVHLPVTYLQNGAGKILASVACSMNDQHVYIFIRDIDQRVAGFDYQCGAASGTAYMYADPAHQKIFSGETPPNVDLHKIPDVTYHMGWPVPRGTGKVYAATECDISIDGVTFHERQDPYVSGIDYECNLPQQ